MSWQWPSIDFLNHHTSTRMIMRNEKLRAFYGTPRYANRPCGVRSPHSNATRSCAPTDSHDHRCAVDRYSGHANNSSSGDSWRRLSISCCLIWVQSPLCSLAACFCSFMQEYMAPGGVTVGIAARCMALHLLMISNKSFQRRRGLQLKCIQPRSSQFCRACVVKCKGFNELLYVDFCISKMSLVACTLSSPAPTLRSWVRMPLEAWIFVRFFCVCFVLCAGSGLATGSSPSKGSYRLWIGLGKLEEMQRPNQIAVNRNEEELFRVDKFLSCWLFGQILRKVWTDMTSWRSAYVKLAD
jgi:hypothetical protein